MSAKKLKPALEAVIVAQILGALRWRREVVAWRQNTGAAKLPGRGGKQTLVRFGVPGAADISGLIAPTGRRLEIEVKRPAPYGAEWTAEQRRFAKAIEDAGGIYVLATSVEDVMRRLDEEVKS